MSTRQQILTIEAGSSIHTLIRYLQDSGANRLIFVLPPIADVVRQEVDLRLLLFYAQREGKEVVLVTPDAAVEHLAMQYGLEYYPSLDALEAAASSREKEEQMRKERGRSSRGWLRPRLVHLLFLPLLFLAIGVYIMLTTPVATVVIEPRREQVEESFTLKGVREEEGALPASGGAVPLGRVVRYFTVVEAVPATGVEREGVTPARGVVTVFNRRKQEAYLPQGTVFRTGNGVEFVSLKAVTVPAMRTEYFMDVPVGVRVGQAEVDVQAALPGSAGNVAKGRIKILALPESEGLEVINPEPTQGGTDRVFTVVTQADRQALEKKLRDAAQTEAFTQLNSALGEDQKVSGRWVLAPTVLAEVVELKIDQPEGTRAERVTGTAEVKGSALTVEYARLLAVAEERLAQKLGTRRVLLPRSVALTKVEVEPQGAGEVSFFLTARGVAQAKVEAERVRRAIAGRTIQEAEEFLRSMEAIASFRIRSEQGRRLPRWERWIDVELRSEPQ